MILQKIEPSILNGLGYIGRLEKKSGNKIKDQRQLVFFYVFIKDKLGYIYVEIY